MDQYEDVSDCEVDHSFFDSDFEGDVKKDATATQSAKTENNEHIQTEGTSLSKPVLKMETKVVEGVCTDEERHEKEKEPQAECTLDSGAYESALPLSSSLDAENASTSGGTSTQGKMTQEKNTPTQIPKIVKEHEENYYTDEEDSSDDSRNQKARCKLSKASSSSKAVKKTILSTSSSTSSPSCNSDTESSDANSDSCLSDFPVTSKKSARSFALLSPRQKSRPGMKSVEVKPKLGECAEDSEDTVTDVTPLSTPDISPIQSFELAASNDKKLKVQRQENVSQDLREPGKDRRCHQKVLHEAVDLNNLLKELNKIILKVCGLSSRYKRTFE
uniref:Uncharacterized protein n=1 Tax=Sphaerodactylus townsendi TaxID=933632 RepID=A0ACB8E7Q8_9SAUR